MHLCLVFKYRPKNNKSLHSLRGKIKLIAFDENFNVIFGLDRIEAVHRTSITINHLKNKHAFAFVALTELAGLPNK